MYYDVLDARYAGDFRMWLRFRDGTAGELDFAGRLGGPVFRSLQDREHFRHFELDPACHTIRWTNGADWAPESLHAAVRANSGVTAALVRPVRRWIDSVRNTMVTVWRRPGGRLPDMPEIARLHGLVVMMFYDDHGRPHFHVRSDGRYSRVMLDTLEINGPLAPTYHSVVREWARASESGLLENWRRARSDQSLLTIAPPD